jgi:hypothetical protein
MAWSQAVEFDTLRSLGFASISGTYVAVGTEFLFPVRLICITNNTDGDMFFSTDKVNDMLFIPRNSFKLFDLTTNRGGVDGIFCLRKGIIFYVRQSSAPSSGGVYLEAVHGMGD